MNKNKKIYYESFEDAIERNRKKIPEIHKKLKNAGVKYILSSWIDLHGVPKTKPVPMSDFELLCLGKGPQFAAHSISFNSFFYTFIIYFFCHFIILSLFFFILI